MSQLNLFEPEQKKQYEYFLLTSPDGNISSLVRRGKLKLHHEIGLRKDNLVSVPHISFFKFGQLINEEILVPLIKNALAGVKSFKAEINDLEIFDHGSKKSLVLNFRNPEPFCQIHYKLIDKLSLHHWEMKPHLTIARSISNKDFSRINDINAYRISGSFLCDTVTLLRKETGSNKKYETYARITLN